MKRVHPRDRRPLGGVRTVVHDAHRLANPWANIGYWSDHQIVYLVKLLETAERFGGRGTSMSDRALSPTLVLWWGPGSLPVGHSRSM